MCNRYVEAKYAGVLQKDRYQHGAWKCIADSLESWFWSELTACWYALVYVPHGPLRLSLQNPGVPALGWTAKPYQLVKMKVCRSPSAVQATEP